MLGVEDIFNLYTKFSNAYFEALGYKIIKVCMQDYDIDEEAFINKIKILISEAK